MRSRQTGLVAPFSNSSDSCRALNLWLLNEYSLNNDWHLAAVALVQYGLYAAWNVHRCSHEATPERAFQCISQFISQAQTAQKYSALVSAGCWSSSLCTSSRFLLLRVGLAGWLVPPLLLLFFPPPSLLLPSWLWCSFAAGLLCWLVGFSPGSSSLLAWWALGAEGCKCLRCCACSSIDKNSNFARGMLGLLFETSRSKVYISQQACGMALLRNELMDIHLSNCTTPRRALAEESRHLTESLFG